VRRRKRQQRRAPDRYEAYAWGHWFCFVNGWVRAENLRFVHMHISAAAIVREAQPGVVLYEVSA
jgi:hypothetical protein